MANEPTMKVPYGTKWRTYCQFTCVFVANLHSIKNTQVTRLSDTQTNIQANPSIFHVQRRRVQTRQNREHIK